MGNRKVSLNWDMESIFPGGSNSIEFAEFRQSIEGDLEKAKTTVAALPRQLDEKNTGQWAAFLASVQDIMQRLDHASGFTNCLTAQDVNDDKAGIIDEEISSLVAIAETVITDIEAMAIEVSDLAWSGLVKQPQLVGAAFFWNELRDNARKQMEPKLEKLASELAVNGYHAWNRLYTKMAGDLKAKFVHEGKTEQLSLGQLATKFNSPDRAVRQQAFEALEKTWKTVDSLAAMALNAQAGFRLSVYKNRRWESPLLEPLIMGRVKKETIEAMWEAVARGNGAIAEFIAVKKKLLKIDDFRWYDQSASIGELHQTYTYEEAADFVVKHLSSFSADLGNFARMAIDDRWIEAEDRPGKAAGGFCTGLDLKKQSRIFMTFSGNYDEMMTMAHELGHAYHSWVLRDRDYFATHYPMNLGETASTFNELLVNDAALQSITSKAEKLSLLDKKINDAFIMFCNIRARFLFDSMFYEERKKGALPKERLNELMVEAQRVAFGDILAKDGYHPLFWAAKLHFFVTDVPFYNFPYTFGYLFAGGIYDRARKEGAGFAEKYRALLADTGSMTTEKVARKHLGIDLTSRAFWDDAVGRVVADIALFKQLAK